MDNVLGLRYRLMIDNWIYHKKEMNSFNFLRNAQLELRELRLYLKTHTEKHYMGLMKYGNFLLSKNDISKIKIVDNNE